MGTCSFAKEILDTRAIF